MKHCLHRLITVVIRAYQWCVSPVCGTCCRYIPTCSHYAEEALTTHGLKRGLRLTCKRLSRCHPWGGEGFDPVPPPAQSSHSQPSAVP